MMPSRTDQDLIGSSKLLLGGDGTWAGLVPLEDDDDVG